MGDINNFQRLGAPHSAGVGSAFEVMAKKFFQTTEALELEPNFSVPVGVTHLKKMHRFDLGSKSPAVLVECKSHTWTQAGNMPSAKMTVWNEAMYYFHIALGGFRRIMFVLRHHRRGLSLASYYLQTHGHMVPSGVEVWEFDTDTMLGERLR
ncbi:hypothetical protein V1290_007236 [Bradyrhizobium sp. AZCC 1578]|uniref:hypothetical protein n=1 Tax=Bradyrhizobium sp. AZCC 1578 TaxID=3117027 RepID=UPI002FF0192F